MKSEHVESCPVCNTPHNDVADLVRELAESDPWCVDARHLYESDLECHYCDQNKPAHADTCLWLRARKMAGMT